MSMELHLRKTRRIMFHFWPLSIQWADPAIPALWGRLYPNPHPAAMNHLCCKALCTKPCELTHRLTQAPDGRNLVCVLNVPKLVLGVSLHVSNVRFFSSLLPQCHPSIIGFFSNGLTCTNPSPSIQLCSRKKPMPLWTNWIPTKYLKARTKHQWSKRNCRPSQQDPRKATLAQLPPRPLRYSGTPRGNETHKPDSGQQFHSSLLKPHCGAPRFRSNHFSCMNRLPSASCAATFAWNRTTI